MRMLLSRIRSLFQGRQLDDDLDADVRAHLDLLTADYVRGGMAPEQARLAARRAFGGVEQMKETYRDRRGLPWIEVLRQDVAYAGRQLRQRPGLAITAILTLGLSIAAAIAVFTVVDGVLFRPLTYPEADRLVVVHSRVAQFGRIPVSDAQFRVWRTSLKSFDGMALLWAYAVNLSGSGEPERAAAARVSPDLFRILGVRPQLGRLLRDDEDQPGRDRVVLLSDQLWRRRFSADRGIVGRAIVVNGVPHEVVGVLPADFRFPRISRLYSIPVDADRPHLWKPLALTENDPLSGLNFAAIGRLSSGVTIQQAQSEMGALQPTIVPLAAPGGGNATIPGELVPLQEQITGASRRGLEVLLAAVGAVLLIACVNVTNLILSRSATRRRELAVRTAVGATRGRLMRQLFTEGVVLSLAGGLVGVAMATVAVRLLVLTAPLDMPRLDEVRIDADVLWFTALITMTTALIVGFLPAWRLPRVSLHDAMKQSGAHSHTAGGAGSRVTQSVLVAGQVTATAVCAIIAGLLFHSLLRVLTVDKGFATAKIVTADLELAGPQYIGRRLPFQRSLLERLRALPGVTAVGLSGQQLLTGTGVNLRVLAEGATVPALERPLVNLRTVNADFFRTFGIAIREGQTFGDADTRRVAVVSASTAARLWPGESAVGKRFRQGPDTSAPIEVVGVAADVRASRLEQPAGLIVYVPYFQAPAAQLSFSARASVSLSVERTADLGTVTAGVRRVVRELDRALPLASLRTMEEVVAESVGERRFLTTLVLLFALMTVLLAAMGIYGVVSQGVAQRTSEIGLRVALGAQRSAVLQMVLRDAWRLLSIGVAIGVPIALLSGSALRAILFEVAPDDGGTIAVVCLLLAGVATAAAYAPARRASRIDAMVALRNE
jgi:putative ABC transport system permease protein